MKYLIKNLTIRSYYKLPLFNFCIKNKQLMDSIKKNLDKLTKIQYEVTQNKATERPYTGEYDKFFEKGEYLCVVCESTLFKSETKFDSGCGWPAFTKPSEKTQIKYEEDDKYGMKRVETLCSNCGAHLGHVFEDGPYPDKTRYCINSASLLFKKK